jgi:hypothetical protein
MSEQRMRAARDREPVVPGASTGRVPLLNLPTWDSFTTADRQQLVRAILRAAQRQLTTAQVRAARERGR